MSDSDGVAFRVPLSARQVEAVRRIVLREGKRRRPDSVDPTRIDDLVSAIEYAGGAYRMRANFAHLVLDKSMREYRANLDRLTGHLKAAAEILATDHVTGWAIDNGFQRDGKADPLLIECRDGRHFGTGEHKPEAGAFLVVQGMVEALGRINKPDPHRPPGRPASTTISGAFLREVAYYCGSPVRPSDKEGSPFYELAVFLLTDYLGLKIKDPRRHIVRALAPLKRRRPGGGGAGK